jgi:hypothetical protein
MSFLSDNIQTKLQHAFAGFGISINIHDNGYIIVEKSREQTKEKISKIVETAGFCPLIAPHKMDGKYVFTIAPYRIPDSFNDLQQKLSKRVIAYYQDSNQFILESDKYDSHYDKNKKNILLCAQGLSGTALVVGLGNGLDIPLEDMANQFERVTVLDIDMVAMGKAIKRLPPHLQKKIYPVQKDLTGLLSLISGDIKQLKSNMSDDSFIKSLSTIIMDCLQKRQACSFPEKYHFVVSSMVTSQLFSQISIYLETVMEEDLKKMCPETIVRLRHFLVEYLAPILCTQHFEQLSEWTKAGGKIYYADTSYGEMVDVEFTDEKRKETYVKQRVIHPTLPIEEVETKIKEIFQINRTENWKWQRVAPVMAPNLQLNIQSGQVFQISALFLQPKGKSA